MRNRACTAGSLGSTECNRGTCGTGFQPNRTVLRSAATVPEIFQTDPQYHNVSTPLQETNNRTHRMYSQGRSLHHPSCNCGNCSRGRYTPETTFKDLLYRQSVGVGEGTARLHSHSQQNGYDHRCCSRGPSFYKGKRSTDDFIDRRPLTPSSSVFSASGDFEQRNVSASAGFRSHVPFTVKTNELCNSSLDTTSRRKFHCSEKAPPGALKKQISLHGWCLMKPISGENTSGCLPPHGVAIGGYRSPQMLQTEFVQTARVEQRLERSKVRTSDGVEVSLVGMIDVNKSIANGFSPALIKYFLIGFPSTWIYMMLNLNINIRGSMPDLPSSSAQQGIDDISGKSQELPVGPSPVLRTSTAPLFTPPSEGTWRDALRSFSPTTFNSLHAGSSDINTTQQCDLDQEQSDRQRDCPNVRRDPQAENFCLLRKTSSARRDCPNSEPEAIGVENSDKVSDGSSQTRKATLFWPRCPGLQGDMAGEAAEAGEDPESSPSEKSVVVKDVPGLAPVSTLGEDVTEVHRGNSQAQETRVVSDCPNSVETVKAGCEGPQNAATEEGTGVVDVDDSIVYSEDFAEDGEHETELLSVQVPFTPLHTSTKPTGNLNKLNTDNSTRGLRTDPVKSLENLDTGKKLRSGRCLLVVGKQIREQVIEDAVENIKTRKRQRNPKKLSSEGCKDVMQSRKLVCSTADLFVHHEDIGKPGGLDPAPSTPSQKSTERVNVSPGSTLVTPITDAETHPVSNLQNVDDTKKLRSGRYLRASGMPVQEPVVSAVIMPQSLRSRKRRRISPTAVPVAECEDEHSIECEGPPCNAVTAEQDTKVDDQDAKDDKLEGHEGDSEVSSRPTGEFCKNSAGVNRPVNRKRHGTVNKLYKSRRKKSCPESFPTSKPKLDSSRSDSHNSGRNNPKVGIDKSFQMEETKPTPRKNSTKVRESSKSTVRVELNHKTSRCISQAEKKFQSGKRNSIVPPPLPTPRVADESKVIEAYGLKKSRSGRIIVPPLAVWCNQSIIYDMDGSIIAISDASSFEAESQTGCFNYMFPSDTGAIKMQKKLLKAARIDWSQK